MGFECETDLSQLTGHRIRSQEPSHRSFVALGPFCPCGPCAATRFSKLSACVGCPRSDQHLLWLQFRHLWQCPDNTTYHHQTL